MAFKKGQSGNPKGRPRGAGKIDKLRGLLTKDVDGIIETVKHRAQDGDIGAAKLILDRAIPN